MGKRRIKEVDTEPRVRETLESRSFRHFSNSINRITAVLLFASSILANFYICETHRIRVELTSDQSQESEEVSPDAGSRCSKDDICPVFQFGPACRRLKSDVANKFVPKSERCCHLVYCENSEISRSAHYVKYSGKIPSEKKAVDEERGKPASNETKGFSECPKLKCNVNTTRSGVNNTQCRLATTIHPSSPIIRSFLDCCPMIECHRPGGNPSFELGIQAPSFKYYEISYYNLSRFPEEKFESLPEPTHKQSDWSQGDPKRGGPQGQSSQGDPKRGGPQGQPSQGDPRTEGPQGQPNQGDPKREGPQEQPSQGDPRREGPQGQPSQEDSRREGPQGQPSQGDSRREGPQGQPSQGDSRREGSEGQQQNQEDPRRDGSQGQQPNQADGPPSQQQPNEPPYQPDGPPYQPDGPPYQPDGPPYQPDGPPYQPDGPPYQPNGPPYQPNGSPYQPNGYPSQQFGQPNFMQPNNFQSPFQFQQGMNMPFGMMQQYPMGQQMMSPWNAGPMMGLMMGFPGQAQMQMNAGGQPGG